MESCHPYTELISVTELAQKGMNADGNQYFLLGFFTDYDPVTATGRLKHPDCNSGQFVAMDLSGVHFTEMAVEDQMCRVFGRCFWKNHEIMMQVHSIKSAVRWDCTLFQETMQKLQQFIGSKK